MLFKLVIISDAQKKLKTQTLLLVGMVCSGFAILISLFNMVMCAQNEFDPIILEKELLDRRETAKKKQQRVRAIEEGTKKNLSAKDRRASFASGSATQGDLGDLNMNKKSKSLPKSNTMMLDDIDLDGKSKKKQIKKQESFM